uniref:type II toxin-antitoxin system death-on-curing family toxin n=1 Tax=Yoonia sp. TaxID=2212373 RepID=UPI004048E9A7
MARRHYRVSAADALEAHQQCLDDFGGLEGLSRWDDLLGALGRPYHGYHRQIWKKAAALLHGVASSHGFNDGNKRTAWLVTELLIIQSGYSLEISTDDRIDDLMVNLVQGIVSQPELEGWLIERIRGPHY